MQLHVRGSQLQWNRLRSTGCDPLHVPLPADHHVHDLLSAAHHVHHNDSSLWYAEVRMAMEWRNMDSVEQHLLREMPLQHHTACSQWCDN